MRVLACLLFFSFSCAPDLDDDGDGFDELTNDCDDSNPNVSPIAIEICDGLDNDCNGEIDELGAKGGTIFYVDLDGDGHGSENGTLEACSLPTGYSTSKRDCDESSAAVHPDADEICDGIDNDCDTHIDEYTAIDAFSWHPDRDGDGYGDAESVVLGCEAPPDHVLDGGDCDDIDPGVNPEARESCETPYDDDCNGDLNDVDAFGCTAFFADIDGDGHGGTSVCLCLASEEYPFSDGGDCDDENAFISPDAEEVLDFFDNDCDGVSEYPLINADVTLGLSDNGKVVVQLGGGDFDDDGVADILVSDTNTKEVSLLYGASLSSGLIEDNRSVVFHGDDTANFARNIMTTIDANTDGVDDIMFSNFNSEGSQNYIFTSPFAEDLTLEDAAVTLLFDHSNQQVLRVEGDFNGDGFADLVVAEETISAPLPGQIGMYSKIGRVAVLLTPLATEVSMEDAAYTILGEQAHDFLGQDVRAGDFNGDGLDDLVVSSLSNTFANNSGSLRFYYHFTTETIPAPSAVLGYSGFFSYLGENLGRIVDFNGDGHLDVVITTAESGYIGAHTVVVYGPFPEGEHVVDTYPMTVFFDPFTYEESKPRHCIEVVGDATGDGNVDLMIGDKLDAGGSKIYLIHDFPEGFVELSQAGVAFTTDGTVTSEMGGCRPGWYYQFERQFMSPGDINGDGLDDMVIAARQRDPNDSTIYSQVSVIWGTQQ